MRNNYWVISEVFKTKRVFLGYSKRELASLVGISHSELSRIEHGERENYNVVTLINLCEVLHLDFIKLLKIAGYLPCKHGDFEQDLLDQIEEFNKSKKDYSKFKDKDKEKDGYFIIAFFGMED